MPSHHRFDDLRTLRTKIDAKSPDLFKAKDRQAPFEVTQVLDERVTNVCHEKEQNRTSIVRVKPVWMVSDMMLLRKDAKATTQIFTVTQDRSWTTLNVSREMMESFFDVYAVAPNLWKCLFAFGRKSRENEFEFPGFSRRRIKQPRSPKVQSYEISYILRRVALHGRVEVDGESPWSIRQTAVYHQFSCQHHGSESASSPRDYASAKSTFLLVAPSANAELQMPECLNASLSDQTSRIACWNMHRMLLADSLGGWSDYLAFLEYELIDQSDKIVLATVGDNKSNLSPLTDFNVNFEDRQKLKMLEDQVLDLRVILPGILESIIGVWESCRECSATLLLSHAEKSELEEVIDELDEYAKEAKRLIERSQSLKAKAKSTAQLLSDLLSYEEAVALKDLAKETQIESKSMCHLAEKSSNDAAAVKVLTIITLVYLPTTIVANFFSTEFVQTKDDGHMSVANNVWLLAAISIPLTLLTILLWWGCVRYTTVKTGLSPENPAIVMLQKQHTLPSFASPKKRQSTYDPEKGVGMIGSPCSPPSASPASTWRSGASTVKSG